MEIECVNGHLDEAKQIDVKIDRNASNSSIKRKDIRSGFQSICSQKKDATFARLSESCIDKREKSLA